MDHPALLANLKHEVTSLTTWDGPPALYMIYTDRVSPLALPEELWAAAPPAQVLARIAYAIHQPDGQSMLSADEAGAKPTGFAFRYYGYAVLRPLDTVPAALRANPESWNLNNLGIGRPSQAPDRVDIRMIAAATMYGDMYSVMLRQDSTEIMEQHFPASEGASQNASGVINAHLADMAFALRTAGHGGAERL